MQLRSLLVPILALVPIACRSNGNQAEAGHDDVRWTAENESTEPSTPPEVAAAQPTPEQQPPDAAAQPTPEQPSVAAAQPTTGQQQPPADPRTTGGPRRHTQHPPRNSRPPNPRLRSRCNRRRRRTARPSKPRLRVR